MPLHLTADRSVLARVVMGDADLGDLLDWVRAPPSRPYGHLRAPVRALLEDRREEWGNRAPVLGEDTHPGRHPAQESCELGYAVTSGSLVDPAPEAPTARKDEMEPRIHAITLAVEDLERALVFYRDGLGLASEGVIGTEFHDDVSGADGAVAMFHLAGGLVLSLYPRTELAKDAGLPYALPTSGEFSLGHFVNSREEVDQLVNRIGNAGGSLREKPRERPWGIYSGYVQDPDGHLWEIMHSLLVDPNA